MVASVTSKIPVSKLFSLAIADKWTVIFSSLFLWPVLLLLLIAILLFGRLILRTREKNRQIQLLRSAIMDLEGDALELGAKNELLVTEMHHRVKNNLQILSSLINSQLSFIKDKTGRDALSNSKHRLYALTLVHQKLFQNAMAPCIEVSCCIRELVDYLTDEFKSKDRISFELDLASLEVDVSFAIPFQLIINELLTNTMKFAFPGERKGDVRIELHTRDHVKYELIYADNGVGLPENVDLLSAKSMGRSLIMGLSRQIKAHVKVNNSRGLEIKIDFSVPKKQPSHFGMC